MRPEALRRTFPFDARAEVTLANSDPVDARVIELSLHGCFLKFPIPLPAATPVLVKIFAESETHEADGTVIYSQPNVGFALAFRDIKPHLLALLQRWLVLAKKKYESQEPASYKSGVYRSTTEVEYAFPEIGRTKRELQGVSVRRNFQRR